jgi:ribonuclease BN (tRNA processing enzyme)
LGYRFVANGSTLGYTGDTGPTEQAVELARDADLMLSEATWQDHQELLPFHLSASQAADHANRAGAKALILTHIWPSLDKETSLEQASEVFRGPVEVAREGMTVKVGS